MRTTLTLLTFAILFISFSICQFDNHEPCSHDSVMKDYLESHPHLHEKGNQLRQQMKLISQNVIANKLKTREPLELIRIPVVFHVLTSEENPTTYLTKEEIEREIKYLNSWFSAKNTYYQTTSPYWVDKDVVALEDDLQIQFELASFDPNNETTTGITFTETSVADSCSKNEIFFSDKGGVDAWNSLLYLNIWTCAISDSAAYAYLPLGETHERDGVVVHPKYVGESYRSGSIIAHEVGHWLGLKHTFENCSPGDEIDDTPPAFKNALSYVSSDSCCPGVNGMKDEDFVQCGNITMVQNCMDYNYEKCKTFFTKEQAALMRSYLENSEQRGLLKTSSGLSRNSENNSSYSSSSISNDDFPIDDQAILDIHNNERDNVFPLPSRPLQHLIYSQNISLKAKQWTDTCTYGYDNQVSYGKNLFIERGVIDDLSTLITAATNTWLEGKNYYTLNENGSFCEFGHSCNSYITMIWDNDDRRTTEIGCSWNFCNSGSPFPDSEQWTIFMCYYNERGNIFGLLPYPVCDDCGKGIEIEKNAKVLEHFEKQNSIENNFLITNALFILFCGFFLVFGMIIVAVMIISLPKDISTCREI